MIFANLNRKQANMKKNVNVFVRFCGIFRSKH